MAVVAFRYFKSLSGEIDTIRELELAPSLVVLRGDLLKMVNGKLALVDTDTDKPDYVARVDVTSTATGGEKAEVAPALRGEGVWKTNISATFSGVAVAAGSSTTAAEITAAAVLISTFIGGLMYCVELNEVRVITANTATGGGGAGAGNVIFTATVPFSQTTLGKTVRVIAAGLSDIAVKLDATTPRRGINVAVAGVSGGNTTIYDVDMSKLEAQVVFNV
jgi:hypothetical protein